MAKKPSVSKLKKKVWTYFSLYIRTKYADPDGNVECVACGIKGHYKTMHASHLVPGRKLGILFDERGVFVCCYGCNVCKHGNYREYDAYMDRTFGEEYRIKLVEELRRLSKQSVKWSTGDYEVLLEKYKNLSAIELKRIGVN